MTSHRTNQGITLDQSLGPRQFNKVTLILILIHEENFRNAHDGYKFRKLMDGVRISPSKDPLRTLYTASLSVTKNGALTEAAAMARVHHIQNYNRKKLYRLVRPASTQRHRFKLKLWSSSSVSTMNVWKTHKATRDGK